MRNEDYIQYVWSEQTTGRHEHEGETSILISERRIGDFVTNDNCNKEGDTPVYRSKE